MKRIIIALLLTIIGLGAYAQSWTPAQYTQAKGLIGDSVLRAPRVDTIWKGGTKDSIGAIVYSPSGKALWLKTDTGWAKVGTGATDLTSYMKYADTSAMLSPYLRIVDTAGLLREIPNLQQVTDAGQETANAISITGDDNAPSPAKGLQLSYNSGARIEAANPSTGDPTPLILTASTVYADDAVIGPLTTTGNAKFTGNGTPGIGKIPVGTDGTGNWLWNGSYWDSTTVKSNVYTKEQADALYVPLSDKGAANGVATLDAGGKVPLGQIPEALLGAVVYQGTYNANTNTPALPTAGSGNKGWYYVVSVAGTQQGLNLQPGDWVISNGSAWGKVDNNNAVTSVFGRTGAVTAQSGDYNTDQITEGSSNLFYTNTRSRAALSGTSPITYNSSTGAIGVQDAGASQSGVVSTGFQTFAGSKVFNNGLTVNSMPAQGGAASLFVTSNSGTLNTRTAAQVLSDIGGAPSSGSGSYIRNGTASQTADFNITGNGFIGNNLTVNNVLSGPTAIYGGLIVGKSPLANSGTYQFGFADDVGFIYFTAGAAGAASAGNAGGDWYLKRYDNSSSLLGTAIFVKRSNGYVGIGTTSPSAPLTVVGTTLSDAVTTTTATVSSNVYTPSVSSGNASSSTVIVGGNSSTNPGAQIELHGGTYATMPGEMSFYTGTGTGIQPERMRITSAGKVGIGITNPDFPLTISADNSTGIMLLGGRAPSSTGGSFYSVYSSQVPTAAGQRLGGLSLGAYGSGYRAGAIITAYAENAWTEGSSQPTYLSFNTTSTSDFSSTEKMRISANGNIGIGTTSPAAKLDVTGGIHASLSVDATDANFSGSLTTQGFIAKTLVITGNRTVSATDYTLINKATSGNPIITLPAASSSQGRIINIVNVPANPTSNGCSWTPAVKWDASISVSNFNNATLSGTPHITIQSDGTDWWIISH